MIYERRKGDQYEKAYLHPSHRNQRKRIVERIPNPVCKSNNFYPVTFLCLPPENLTFGFGKTLIELEESNRLLGEISKLHDDIADLDSLKIIVLITSAGPAAKTMSVAMPPAKRTRRSLANSKELSPSRTSTLIGTSLMTWQEPAARSQHASAPEQYPQDPQ